MVLGRSVPAWAHHGFLGHYDFAHPLFVRGKVTQAEFGRPHARLRIETAPDQGPELRAVNADLIRELEDAEQRQMATLIRPLQDAASVEVVLDVKVSRELSDEPWMLRVGDMTTVVVYRRLGRDEYAGELTGVALSLNDGRSVVGSTRVRTQASSRR